jgi:hypothetical protein
MDIVVNRTWGSFSIPKEIADKRGLSIYDDIDRNDEELVEYVNTHDSSLKALSIPDEATDWAIWGYDGMETIIYVVDGKIYHA